MKPRNLVGAGHLVMAGMLPVAVAVIVANVVWPEVFRMGFGTPGLVAGVILLALGTPLWLWAVVQILVYVPKGRLITTGPYALVFHPIYTFVALLVIPGVGFVLDTWLCSAVGVVLYVSSRIFAPREERELARSFPSEYASYRERVLLPWL